MQDQICLPFLNIGDTFASFHILGNFAWSMDLWKIIWRTEANSLWKFWSSIGLSWSGPDALRGLSIFNRLSIPLVIIWMSAILVYGLDVGIRLTLESYIFCRFYKIICMYIQYKLLL